MPERAKARRADWAPGPGVFVLQHHSNTQLCLKRGEPKMLARAVTDHGPCSTEYAIYTVHTLLLALFTPLHYAAVQG